MKYNQLKSGTKSKNLGRGSIFLRTPFFFLLAEPKNSKWKGQHSSFLVGETKGVSTHYEMFSCIYMSLLKIVTIGRFCELTTIRRRIVRHRKLGNIGAELKASYALFGSGVLPFASEI